MKPITFLKLGGSLITDKQKPYTPKPAVIARLAREIQAARSADPSLHLLIGNGVGSFSHYAAQKYNYPLDPKRPDFQEGFATIHQASVAINKIVVDALLKAGVPAFSIHPSSCIVSENTHKKSILVEQIPGLLEQGIVPVVYGDILYDTVKGATIYSTERVFEVLIAEFLMRKHRVASIIQATVVPGILDKNNKVIPHVSQKSYETVKSALYKTAGFDVTGGMLHKIDQSLGYAQKGIVTQIISGLKPGRLRNVLLGKKEEGTIIS